MRRLKRWGLVGLLILLGLEILTIAPKKVGSPQDERKQPIENLPIRSSVATMSQRMHGVQLFGTTLGHKEWELQAISAEAFKDKGTWDLQGVKVKFFGNAGSTYTVTGESGSVQTETKDMEIRGNVVTTTSEGYVFKTKSLKYGAKNKELVTPEEVVITGPKENGPFQLSGRDFKATLDTSVMTLKRDVEGIKELSAEKTMNIKSVWSRINGKTGGAHFEDQVQVDLEAVRMTGESADFEYEKDSHVLKSLLMKGNVKVTDQRHWASSQYAQVLFAENEFVLYGHPRVIQDDNELRGEEIRFLDGGKQVSITKARARVENRSDFLKETRK
jgi:LPS export ABC transporter protein LptC